MLFLVLVALLLYLLFVIVSYTVIFVTVEYRQIKGLQGIPPARQRRAEPVGRLPPQFSEKNEMVLWVASRRKIALDKVGWGVR